MMFCAMSLPVIFVAPARERGLKYAVNIMRIHMSDVAPARERGLKSQPPAGECREDCGRSREGAWIEI